MEKLKKLFSKKQVIKSNIRWLLEQAGEVKFYIFVFSAISLFSMLFSLASPIASKFVVDSAISPDEKFNIKYAFVMFGTTLISIVFSAFSNIFSSYANEKYSFHIRAKMFDRTQKGKWNHINMFHSGDMLSRLTSDVDTVTSNIISIFPTLIITILQLVIILVILLMTDPVLALIGLIVGPLGMVLGLVLRKPYQRYQRTLKESQSEYYTFFQEMLGNLDITKAFQLEEKNNENFEDLRERRLKTVIKSTRLSTLISSAMRFVYSLGYVVAFCWCATQIGTKPEYTYGTMTLFLSLVAQLQGTISSIGNIVPQFYNLLISALRIREISEQPAEKSNGKEEYNEKIGLDVSNVTFSYTDTTILKDVNFKVEPYEKVGIIGSSGAGKTTFIRLILALVEPTEGNINFTLNGEAEEITASARRFISYVPQGNTLFTGTVRENLLVSNPLATDEMLWEALKIADAEKFISEDERKLDLPIKENSGGLSAGQAQRVCIARALLRDKPVMIFDEATSALDEESEKRIFENISNLQNKTFFIITHRKSMLKYCTSILKINDDGTAEYTKN